MIVDGRAIAANILASVKTEVEALGRTPTLTAITCAPNFETKKYLEMKKRRAAQVGIGLNVVELPDGSKTSDVVDCIQRVAKESDGIVVQLPLPEQIDRAAVLRSVPVDKDPDGFSYRTNRHSVLPPVVGAIDEISTLHDIVWKNQRVVILGQGSLVGIPAAQYARKRGAKVRVYEQGTLDVSSLKTADIIVSGIGHPKFITAEMIQSGVVIFDAGTSEDGGVLVGDADSTVEEHAKLVTPVPGGIGPITIAVLLRNLLAIARQ